MPKLKIIGRVYDVDYVAWNNVIPTEHVGMTVNREQRITIARTHPAD